MRKSDYLIDAIYNLIVICACCAVSSILAALVCKIISSFVEAEFFTYAIIRSVVITLGSIGAICAVKYKEGFKAGEFVAKEAVIGTSIGALAHVLVGLLFSFIPLVSGAPIYVIGMICHGAMLDEELITEVNPLLTLAVAVVLGIIYVTVASLAKSYGAQSRKIEKYQLTGKL